MKPLSSGGSGPSVPAHRIGGDPSSGVRPAPLTSELWAAYEATSRSYTCTRAFIEYFERPSSPTLALVRGASDADVRAAFLFQHDGAASVRVLGRLFAPPPEAFHAFVEAVLARYPGASHVETDLLDAFADGRAAGRRPC